MSIRHSGTKSALLVQRDVRVQAYDGVRRPPAFGHDGGQIS